MSADLPPAELAERYLPQLAGDARRLIYPCFYDTQPARDLPGFVATRTWRKVLEGAGQ